MAKEYAEIYRGFVVGKHLRDDARVPEFVPPRFAVKIRDEEDDDFDDITANIGDEFTRGRFRIPTRPNPNLEPPVSTDRELLEEILTILRK